MTRGLILEGVMPQIGLFQLSEWWIIASAKHCDNARDNLRQDVRCVGVCRHLMLRNISDTSLAYNQKRVS